MLLVDYLFSQLNLDYTILHANVMNIRFSGEIKVALVRISNISLPIIGQIPKSIKFQYVRLPIEVRRTPSIQKLHVPHVDI